MSFARFLRVNRGKLNVSLFLQVRLDLAMMSMKKRIVSGVVAALAAVSLAGVAVPAALAATKPASAVAAVRTFPAQKNAARSNLLAESKSVTVGSQSWGGIESLNVPQTQAAQQASPEAASRSEVRTAPKATTQNRQQASSAASSSASAAQSQAAANQAAANAVQVPTSKDGAAVASYAVQFAGKVPYVYGGSTTAGWDCSGFTMFVFSHFGVNLPHSSYAQGAYGTPVPADQAQPGDLMVRSDGGHVGIYIGNGMMVHAATPSQGTIISPITYASFKYYRIVK